jgi:hypothetical protein
MLAEMNVLHEQGKLTPAQATFFASSKPPIELFDLRSDPHEINNVADDPNYAAVRNELLDQLDHWRSTVIDDRGVSDDFRAEGIFPDVCPAETVDYWVRMNKDKVDLQRYGLPSWYPTRTLAQWKSVRDNWQPYVFREPNADVKRPKIVGRK